jgi:hypothetical protein
MPPFKAAQVYEHAAQHIWKDCTSNPATSSELKVRSVLMSTLPFSLFQVAAARAKAGG